MNSGKEISGKFVVACGDSAEVFELVEEALDEIAFAVERVVACPLHFAVGLWRDYRGDFVLGESLDQRIGVVGLIGEQGAWIGAVDQRLRAGQIVRLPRRKHQFDRIAQGIDQGMDFGGQSAAGSADRLLAVFFRAPALC